MIRRFQSGGGMRGTRHWSSVKPVIAILSAACFLTTSLGSVSRAVAADTIQVAADDAFETWPKKPAEPGVAPTPPPDANGAALAGDTAGKETSKGLSGGTIGWIAAGTAVIIGIAIAAGSGGGGGGSSTTPTH
jgi:hypothetical protein